MHGTYSGSPINDGIHINNADQPGAYVYLRGGRFGSSIVSLAMNNLSNVLVNADDFQDPYDSGPCWVTQNGSNHFNQFLGTGGSFSLSGAANAQMIGGWAEASNFLIQSSISGSGSFVHSTAYFGDPPNDNAYNLNNFTGTFAILNSAFVPNTCPITGHAINATGSGSGGLIVSALDIFATPSPISNTAGSALQFFGNVQTQCLPLSTTADNPSPPTLSTVASALQYFRNTRPLVPKGNPSGTSAIELYDLFVDGFATAIQITP